MLITVPYEGAGEDLWPDLGKLLHSHKGTVPVFVDLVGSGLRLRTRVTNGGGVEASDRLADRVEEMLEPGAVQFGIRRNGSRPGNGNGRRNGRWRRAAR